MPPDSPKRPTNCGVHLKCSASVPPDRGICRSPHEERTPERAPLTHHEADRYVRLLDEKQRLSGSWGVASKRPLLREAGTDGENYHAFIARPSITSLISDRCT